jgi:3'-phosphoadenosine 5'-phosphosulfate sulfotransferase (PAPS reductase)/FAD synthetase
MDIQAVRMRMNLDLDTKIHLSKIKIQEFLSQTNAYIAYSGGKDSIVLRHLVLSINKNIPVVYHNTGNEFPEIYKFATSYADYVTTPKISFKEVTEKFGWPVISKEVSRAIHNIRNGIEVKKYFDEESRYHLRKKYRYLIKAPFKISDYCCNALKKNPANKFARNNKFTGVFTGERVEESRLRMTRYLKYGCNNFGSHIAKSTPIAFWTHKDVENYINVNKLDFPKYYYMNYDRTGCVFCLFGIMQMPDKFLKLQVTEKELWRFGVVKLGLLNILNFMNIPCSWMKHSTEVFIKENFGKPLKEIIKVGFKPYFWDIGR